MELTTLTRLVRVFLWAEFMKYLLLILTFIVTAASATDCPQHYLAGMQPTTHVSRELCYSEFAVGYSDDKKSAIYVVEHITKDELIAADLLVRKDKFHEEPRVPVSDLQQLTGFNVFPSLPAAQK